MTLGKPLKKWAVNMMTAGYRDDERIGILIQGEDFFLFSPSDARRETIVYPRAEDVRDVIKLQYGREHKFSLGSVETFF